MAAACLAAAVYVLTLFGQQTGRVQALEAERRELAAELAAARARNDQLKERVALLHSPEYVEALARERLGYIRAGEIPFMALDDQGQDR